MFLQRVSIYPAMGKDSELRDTLTEWIKKRQSQGMNVGLSSQLFGAEGTTFVTTTFFSDLAEFDNRRRTNMADRDFQAAVTKFNSLSRAPAKFELFEVLVPLPPGGR